ncbi:MAG: hypothetical protein GC181_02430 [Bacteroidetes bacterium]|nr:hypothetical protein [Bacteroidota bacterium]
MKSQLFLNAISNVISKVCFVMILVGLSNQLFAVSGSNINGSGISNPNRLEIDGAMSTYPVKVYAIALTTSVILNYTTNLNVKRKVTSGPFLNFYYGRKFNERFELGGLFSREEVKATLTSDSFDHPLTYLNRRSNFSLVPTFHYIKKENLELYSSIRLGVSMVRRKATVEHEFSALPTNWSSRKPGLSFGMTLIGVRTKICGPLMANFQLGFGVPSVLQAGLSARF